MEEDRVISEAYEEIENKKEKQEKGVWKDISKNSRILFVGGVGALALAIYTEKIELKTGAILLGILIAIVYSSVVGGGGEKKLLTEQECAIQLYRQLKFKQNHRLGNEEQINPNHKVKVTHVSQLAFLDGKPWKRAFGVIITNPETNLPTYWGCSVNPRDGDIIEMKEFEGGFVEMEQFVKNIQRILDRGARDEKYYHDETGKYYDKRR